MILKRSVTNSVHRPVRRDVISHRFGAVWRGLLATLALSVTLGLCPMAQAEKLPLERIFAAPDLNGPALRGLEISPDGRLVAYLRAREDDKDRFDLWAYDLRRGKHRLLV